jgi:hypothetical protein
MLEIDKRLLRPDAAAEFLARDQASRMLKERC